MLYLLPSIKQHFCFRFHTFLERFSRWIKPPTIFLVLGTFAELLAENALLRQQLIILRLIASVSIVRNFTLLRWVCSYLFDSKEATIRWFSKICAEEGSSHMKSQYGSPSQAASSTLSGVRGRFNPINYDGNYCCVCDVCHCKHFCFIRSRNFLSSPFLYACIDVFPGFNYNGMTNKHKKHAQQNSAPVRKCNYVR